MKRRGLSDDASAAAEELLELIAALSAHDRLTRGHAERVRAYSRMIGEELHLSDDDLNKLHWGGLLHDVGKLFVPTEILNKPGELTDEEFEIMKGHPGWGAELCEPLRGWLGEWVDAVGQHHERWTGGGYPTGVAGEGISLAARVVAVADAFDVMTSARSYKPPVSAAAARDELTRCAGSQFDPRVVRAFLNVSLGRLRLVMGPLSSLAQLPLLGRVPIGPALGGAVSGLATAAVLLVGGLVSTPDGGDRHRLSLPTRSMVTRSPCRRTSLDGDDPAGDPASSEPTLGPGGPQRRGRRSARRPWTARCCVTSGPSSSLRRRARRRRPPLASSDPGTGGTPRRRGSSSGRTTPTTTPPAPAPQGLVPPLERDRS